jgi:cell division protein FtsL
MNTGKHDILEETREIIAPSESMGPLFLRNVFVGVFLILVVVFPKIFINTQIYFKSREISTLTHEHDALMEENRLIKAKVEELKYKSQIADTLF